MGETPDQIKSHIEKKREELKSDLQELKTRIKSATDWRHYFRNHTGPMVAAAFGAGILLSKMVGKRKRTGVVS
jgi:hypothetical protein